MAERKLKVTVRNFVDLSNGKKGPINVPFEMTPTEILKNIEEVGAKFCLGFNWEYALTAEQVKEYIAKDKAIIAPELGTIPEVKKEEDVKPVAVETVINADTHDEENTEITPEAPVETEVNTEVPTENTGKKFNKR